MRLLALATLLMTLSSCATLETTGAILDILAPDPVPVCEEGAAGVRYEGRQCVKLSDGSYEWRAEK